MIRKELLDYIEKAIFPCYEKNDSGHNIDHIQYVINRSMKFAQTVPGINMEMVYVIAAYHDIGHSIDAKNHEKISSEILFQDDKLKSFFNDDEITTMAEAVYDHRASLEYEPRSIYGKIVSSADRNTSRSELLKRTLSYRMKHNPNDTLDEIIEDSRRHVIDKFGKNGYAVKKMYFDDPEYREYLAGIESIAEDEDAFRREFIKVNGLDNPLRYYYCEIRRRNPDLPLDKILKKVYKESKDPRPYLEVRKEILEVNSIHRSPKQLGIQKSIGTKK